MEIRYGKKKRIVLIGLGRQGWAILRQFLKLVKQKREADGYEIYVYDKDKSKEDRLLPDDVLEEGTDTAGIFGDFWDGRIRKLREQKVDTDIDIKAAIRNLCPDLLINASTSTGHEFYTACALEANCDYIDLGQSTQAAMKQRALDQLIARDPEKMLRIVPECGLAPGLVNIIGDWLLLSPVGFRQRGRVS